MHKILSFFFILLLLFPYQSPAWGPTGHRVVGQIAELHLSRKAKRALAKIMGAESLAKASNWMDFIKSTEEGRAKSPWHYVNIPRGKSYEDTSPNPQGDVIIHIERIIAELKSGNITDLDERESIRFLTHLVGDLHQPLHAGYPHDRGGNDIEVEWFRNPSNLHRVWDSDIIDRQKLSFTEFVSFINHPSKEDIITWQKANVRDWMRESIALRDKIYDELPENKRLSYRYIYDNIGRVEKRLLQAGIRLAGILNSIYG